MSKRPEHVAPPEIFYDEDEAEKYATSTRMMEIQTTMSHRAIELLNLPPNEEVLILDLGCGSGLSGEVLSELGYQWIGLDISPSMLKVAQKREVEGDLLENDLGHGVPFRPGTFDGAISISALQWLCNADKSYHNPRKRLIRLFETLYTSLRRGARAVFQFYPETPQQMELITASAMRCGFTGGLVVDYPNSTKAKKYFLCLFAGVGINYELPTPLGVEEATSVDVIERERSSARKHGKKGPQVKSKDWIVSKKDRQRKQGKSIKNDSKYTARKRPNAF